MRIDGGRKVCAFYDAFLEWPLWMLHKSDAWLCFGALRTNIIYDVKGGICAVFALAMRNMFMSGAANFTTGFVIDAPMIRCSDARNGNRCSDASNGNRCSDARNGNRCSKVIKASLKGIISDEKGLKEAFDIKGAGGKKPCISCQNILSLIHI